MNNRKLLQFVVAVVVSLVLLGFAGSAQAAPTVLCVPSLSVNGSCTVAYATIQLAVSNALAGDTVIVGPGTYTENVLINSTQNNLSLFGAQAGVDARERLDPPARESILNCPTGAGTTSSAIIVEAPDVVIDGFTVQNCFVQGPTTNPSGNNATGIDLKGSGGGVPFTPATGARVVNNILQGNATGVSVNSEGFGFPTPLPATAPATVVSNVLIAHNVFRNNNGGPCLPGPYPACAGTGDGIFTSAANNLTITENDFCGNETSAIGINNSYNVTIIGNRSEDDATFVIFTSTTEATFSDNRGKNFGRLGAFYGAGDGAVAVGPSNNWITISHNDLEDGNAPSNSGISFTNIFGNGSNKNMNVAYNKIRHMPSYGIFVAAAPTALTSLLSNSVILDNEVSDNEVDGIYLDASGVGDLHNVVAGNDSTDNESLDCHDTTLGSQTAGTADTWIDNFGRNSSPVGLCTPEHHEHHDHDHDHDRDHDHDHDRDHDHN